MIDIDRSNRRRKSVRKWMLIAIIPVSVAVLLYGVKVVTMNSFAESSLNAYSNGDMTAAQQNAGRLKFANWFETWKAYYDNGTALVALGSYDLATPELETALALYEDGRDLEDEEVKDTSCQIRGNLAISYEGLGDDMITDKKFDEAQTAYDKAKEAIKDCNDDGSEETKQRLDGKGEEDSEPQEPEPSEAEIEDIQEQLDENNEERQNEESSDQSNTNGDYGGGESNSPDPVDKPW